MASTGDQRVSAGILAALRKGPLDVLGILEVLRPLVPGPLARHEGGLHACLLRLVRRGAVVPAGTTERGLARYVLPEEHGASLDDADRQGHASPAPGDAARHAARVASAVKAPDVRERVRADVEAHLRALGEDATSAFGSYRAARHYLRRVDRGRPTVCFSGSAFEGVRRFALDEGPWLLAAVVVFFVVRAFVAEVFVIPSGSMVPTLTPSDRVVVFKPGGSGRPDRWQIMTFEVKGTTYVKRAVGLGGDALALVDGDVYVNGQMEVKPDAVREALRFAHAHWDFESQGTPPGWARTMPPGERSVAWTWVGEQLRSTPPGHGRSMDVPLRDAYGSLEVTRAAGETVVLAFDYAPPLAPTTKGRVTFALTVGKEAVSLVRIDDGRLPVPLAPVERGGPPPSGALMLRLSHVDGILRADAAGWRFETPSDLLTGLGLRPRLQASGEDSRPLRLVLERDLHYSRSGQLAVPRSGSDDAPASYAFKVPEGHVFMLGDNTHDSRDSRYRDMGPVPEGAMIGPVHLRIWPLSRIGVVR